MTAPVRARDFVNSIGVVAPLGRAGELIQLLTAGGLRIDGDLNGDGRADIGRDRPGAAGGGVRPLGAALPLDQGAGSGR